MPRKEKPTFVVELHMQASPRDVGQLNDRMECGKRIINATLQDGLRIVERLRNDPAWASARKMQKGAVRNEAFKPCATRTVSPNTAFKALPFTQERSRVCRSYWRAWNAGYRHAHVQGARAVPVPQAGTARFKG
jgi:hypothetical protein